MPVPWLILPVQGLQKDELAEGGKVNDQKSFAGGRSVASS